MRTTRTWIETPYEALLFPGIGFGPFLRNLGPTGHGTVSGRQFLKGVGLPKGNGGVQRENAEKSFVDGLAIKRVISIGDVIAWKY
ncbi:hypothetical protein ZIOFF_045111 [Zingiber officinale]|uniref:Uncharacterized protein n=1 Tax=Zingiber officinale TaxID=94328 RepID=A0A8J5FYG6_ZINOF|nr:hypothetical protein ZIOFF_045111 [Zingiber officinale]